MSNLAQSAVTENGFWLQTGATGGNRKVVDATLVLTGQGGGTNLIQASLFDMTKIDQVLNMRNVSGKIYIAAPDTAGAGILISAASAATAAQAAPTFKFLVHVGVDATGGPTTITVAGIATTDNLVGVVDITGGTPATLVTSVWTITGTNTITQASSNTSTKYLLFIVANAAAAPTTTLTFTPADVTDTVRCLVIGPRRSTAQQTYVNDTVGGPQ